MISCSGAVYFPGALTILVVRVVLIGGVLARGRQNNTVDLSNIPQKKSNRPCGPSWPVDLDKRLNDFLHAISPQSLVVLNI